MRFRGQAGFAPDGEGLQFTERGLLTLGSHSGEADRRYLFRPDGPAMDVFFDDGRPFHRLDLSAGQAVVHHDCAPDRYAGRYRVLAPDAWTVIWRITGPRKRQVIGSRFDRMGVAGRA